MKKTRLTILNAGIAFVMAFILSQFTLSIGVSITDAILSACGKTTSSIEIFWDSASGYLLKSIYLNLAFIGLFVWYFKAIGKQNLLQKPNKHTLKYVSICIVIGIATIFLLSGTLNYFELFLTKIGLGSSADAIELNSLGDYLISLVSLALIPAVCEELMFRGVLINSLKHKGHIFAIVFSSLMFAIFHFSPSQLIYPICFGLIFGIVFLRTNNIIFTILLHFINNALSLSIQYFSNSSGAFTHSMPILIYSIITLAVWIAIIVWMFKDFKAYNQAKLGATNLVQSGAAVNGEIEFKNETNDKPNNEKLDNRVFYGSITLMVLVYILLLFA